MALLAWAGRMRTPDSNPFHRHRLVVTVAELQKPERQPTHPDGMVFIADGTFRM